MLITDLAAPYLNDAMIEKQAEWLLRSYEGSYGTVDVAPVPIEDIIERYLGLQIEYDDFTRSKYFGEHGESVLGYIDMQGKRIFINELIEPSSNPNAHEGRFYFTLGHETGHYVLHREMIEEFMAQTSFFDADEQDPQPAILCRHPDDMRPQQRPFIERHADTFSSAILMPKKLILSA